MGVFVKPSTIFGLAALAVGGYLAWKFWPQLSSAVSPDPTVTTLAGSTYMGSSDIPGDAYNAAGVPNPGPGQYNPVTSSPGGNAALNGALGASGSGMNLGSIDA